MSSRLDIFWVCNAMLEKEINVELQDSCKLLKVDISVKNIGGKLMEGL